MVDKLKEIKGLGREQGQRDDGIQWMTYFGQGGLGKAAFSVKGQGSLGKAAFSVKGPLKRHVTGGRSGSAAEQSEGAEQSEAERAENGRKASAAG
ncbi:hypothetical protein GGTG_04659 [Gaeumannomyces tritici R3-111a-1]|uniref:Uncharacterized protein n=1 Tax=Gaeumannomyces tritici (strain R3-111a-1) TaxID=644352 RepID=J3NTQ9_GAET3|nr:hypothetical protein GGTG_04659 [Gaeumannomyces tritici R3-111a-1]EJT79574.1 hypothetical protein GGTG_04659 [Gaeumannomyces tritici R3-111a-1]